MTGFSQKLVVVRCEACGALREACDDHYLVLQGAIFDGGTGNDLIGNSENVRKSYTVFCDHHCLADYLDSVAGFEYRSESDK